MKQTKQYLTFIFLSLIFLFSLTLISSYGYGDKSTSFKTINISSTTTYTSVNGTIGSITCSGTDRLSNISITATEITGVCSATGAGSGSSFNATYDTWLGNFTVYRKFWYNMTYGGSTYNATYDSGLGFNSTVFGTFNNASYLTTYNATYAFNSTLFGTLNNDSYLSIFNSSYLLPTNVAFTNQSNVFTANQNMSSKNVTQVNCIRFLNNAEWCGV